MQPLCLLKSVLCSKCSALWFIVLSLLGPCRIVPRCICLVCYAVVECWAYKWLALCLLTCMSLCSFQVWMSTVITTLWCSLGWSSHGLFINSIFAWFHIACFICIYNFLPTIIIVYCCVSGVYCSYDSSASQLLELGVSEFCSTVPNSQFKSRVCFRVLSRNSQRGRL